MADDSWIYPEPPEDELAFDALNQNAAILGEEWARVNNLKVSAVVMQFQGAVINAFVQSPPVPRRAYEYLTMYAVKIAHEKGLGEPERGLSGEFKAESVGERGHSGETKLGHWARRVRDFILG